MRGIKGIIRNYLFPVGDAKADECHHVDRGDVGMNPNGRVLAAGRS